MSDTIEISTEEYRAFGKQKARGKFGNVKQTRMWQGKEITLDSTAEANRFDDLVLMQEQGVITDLVIQAPFDIIVNDKKVGRYIADFEYRDPSSGRIVVEDVKGMKTPLYRLKKKLVEALYNVTIIEVTAS